MRLNATGGEFDDIEPISRFHEAFQGDVNAAYAAAVVGLETEVFLEKIRENVGLQNAGLLVLDSANGNVKRDAWTSSFEAVVSALNFPTPPSVVMPPEQKPGAVVRILDLNLRAAIAEALGKSHNALITVEDMEGLSKLDVRSKGIPDLTGLQFATNLSELNIGDNEVSDLSPIAGLINLKELLFGGRITDLSDLTPLAGLINLEVIHGWGNPISDLSPLAGLTKLRHIYLPLGKISDLTPLANLTELQELYLYSNNISDLSPLAGLTNLKRLNVRNNDISAVSSLAGLTNLKWLNLEANNISDLPSLDGLRENLTTLRWHGNPAFPKGGPKIEGPWLWVVLPDTELEGSKDLLSEASGGTVTEVEIATHGATEGKSVGEVVWASHRLPPTGRNNIEDTLKRSIDDGVIYGTVSLHSPREQETTIYVGSDSDSKVWLNGTLIYEDRPHWGDLDSSNYKDFFPVTLKQGRNVLLVAVHAWGNGFFGFEPGTEYTVQTPLSATLFLSRQFTVMIPLPSTSVQKMSSTWQVGNLILPLTPLRLKPLM